MTTETTDKIMPEIPPDDERDALWNPVLWLSGDHPKYLQWVARLPLDQVGRLSQHITSKDGKVWLTDTFPLSIQVTWRGRRLLTGLFDQGAGRLRILLQLPWDRVRRAIEQAGEDPFSLPIADTVAHGLWSDDTRLNALAWVRDLPYEIAANEDIVAILGILAPDNPMAASILTERNFPPPRPWKPFIFSRSAPEGTILTPSIWRAAVKILVLKWGYSLHDILSSRMDARRYAVNPEPQFSLPDIDTTTIVLGETLEAWSRRECIRLVEPELEQLTIDPRVGLWQELIRQHIAALNSNGKIGKDISPEEIQEATGCMIGNDAVGLAYAAARAFRNDPNFMVRYDAASSFGEEGPTHRYFSILRRSFKRI